MAISIVPERCILSKTRQLSENIPQNILPNIFSFLDKESFLNFRLISTVERSYAIIGCTKILERKNFTISLKDENYIYNIVALRLMVHVIDNGLYDFDKNLTRRVADDPRIYDLEYKFSSIGSYPISIRRYVPQIISVASKCEYYWLKNQMLAIICARGDLETGHLKDILGVVTEWEYNCSLDSIKKVLRNLGKNEYLTADHIYIILNFASQCKFYWMQKQILLSLFHRIRIFASRHFQKMLVDIVTKWQFYYCPYSTKEVMDKVLETPIDLTDIVAQWEGHCSSDTTKMVLDMLERNEDLTVGHINIVLEVASRCKYHWLQKRVLVSLCKSENLKIDHVRQILYIVTEWKSNCFPDSTKELLYELGKNEHLTADHITIILNFALQCKCYWLQNHMLNRLCGNKNLAVAHVTTIVSIFTEWRFNYCSYIEEVLDKLCKNGHLTVDHIDIILDFVKNSKNDRCEEKVLYLISQNNELTNRYVDDMLPIIASWKEYDEGRDYWGKKYMLGRIIEYTTLTEGRLQIILYIIEQMKHNSEVGGDNKSYLLKSLCREVSFSNIIVDLVSRWSEEFYKTRIFIEIVVNVINMDEFDRIDYIIEKILSNIENWSDLYLIKDMLTFLFDLLYEYGVLFTDAQISTLLSLFEKCDNEEYIYTTLINLLDHRNDLPSDHISGVLSLVAKCNNEECNQYRVLQNLLLYHRNNLMSDHISIVLSIVGKWNNEECNKYRILLSLHESIPNNLTDEHISILLSLVEKCNNEYIIYRMLQSFLEYTPPNDLTDKHISTLSILVEKCDDEEYKREMLQRLLEYAPRSRKL